MAASRPYTWNDSTPGYKITARGPEALSAQIDAAIAAKDRAGERPTSFGIQEGSPQKIPSNKMRPRFAGGDGIIGFINGDFGGIVNGENTESKKQVGKWVNLYASGPMSDLNIPGAA